MILAPPLCCILSIIEFLPPLLCCERDRIKKNPPAVDTICRWMINLSRRAGSTATPPCCAERVSLSRSMGGNYSHALLTVLIDSSHCTFPSRKLRDRHYSDAVMSWHMSCGGEGVMIQSSMIALLGVLQKFRLLIWSSIPDISRSAQRTGSRGVFRSKECGR